MKCHLKTCCAVAAVALTAMVSQPVLADGGWGHHHGGGYGRGWAPFALGAVIGGVAIGAMMQPQPVYAQPVYGPPPPVYLRPRVVMPPPVYVVPAPPPPVFYSY